MIKEAVDVRLESDVPMGALLSGGLDSSGVVALMAQRTGVTPVRTFSVGFEEKEYDELRYAREVSRRYGTEHTESKVFPDMLSVLPLLVERFGEPFADPAAVPVYHITKVARRYVTVALCGDGGDESFAGYHRYKLNALLGRPGIIPSWLSKGLFKLLRVVPHSGKAGRALLWVGKRLLQVLPLSPEVRNVRFYGHFDNEMKAAIYTPEFAESVAGIDTDELVLHRYREAGTDNFLDATLYADINTYLPDTLLPKADVASMANSLELRSPLLDHELMGFAARLPADMKLRRLTTKYALKKIFASILPPGIATRRKMGFGVPLDRWYRGELRDMVRDTLLSRRATGRGYFREETVRRILDEHAENRWRWHGPIYNLLMLELWHRRFIDR